MQTASERPIPNNTFKNSLRTWQARYLAQKTEGQPAEEKDQVAALAAALKVKPERRPANRK